MKYPGAFSLILICASALGFLIEVIQVLILFGKTGLNCMRKILRPCFGTTGITVAEFSLHEDVLREARVLSRVFSDYFMEIFIMKFLMSVILY